MLRVSGEVIFPMRWLLLIGVLASLIAAGNAAEKMTLAQLEQLIAQHSVKSQEAPKRQHARGSDEIAVDLNDDNLLHQLDQDDDLISDLDRVELTERMSTLTLYRLVGKYGLGAHAQQALEQLADRSALLKLPPSEQLLQAPPDSLAQQKMLAASRNYVVGELSHLPDFIATETTTRYDNSPVTLKYFQSMTDAAGFHSVGVAKHQITFRDGKEVIESSQESPEAKREKSGLESRGEFGAEAAVVLMDMEKGTAVFDHWEQTMGGPAAVFHYVVPRESSHYEVTDECKEHVSFHDTPGYQGDLAVDPNSGAILRMTLETESKSGDPVTHIASVVEYGPVVLGRRRSFCPLRSLAFMVEEINGCSHGKSKLQQPLAMINQTIFFNYRRFGSSITIIPNGAESGETPPAGLPDKSPTGVENGIPARPAVSPPSRRP